MTVRIAGGRKEKNMLNLLNKFSRLNLEKVRCKYSGIVTRYNSNQTSVFNIPKSRFRRQEPQGFIKWLVLGIPVGSFGLGCWQARRLQWKLGLIDMLKRKANTEPVPLPQDMSELSNMEYTPVRVRGRFLHDRELLMGPRALIDETKAGRPSALISDPKTNQGWLVITPFQLSDTNEVILVNRGWIPSSLRPSERRAASNINHEVELVGVVRLTEKRPPFMMRNKPEAGVWQYRDLEELSAHTGSEAVWLDVRGVPDPPPGWPIPNQTRVTLRNEHLSYLVTWFSLSGFTGFMWYRYFVRRLPLL